jgi:Flp pilus assembly secretin CpaC
MRVLARSLLLALGVVSIAVSAGAQNQPPSAAGVSAVSIPLRIQLVIARYQGEKKISSVPFTLFVNATDLANHAEEQSRVQIGVEVPMPAVPPPAEAKPNAAGQAAPLQYRPFGTNINCFAKVLDNGRFKLSIAIDESMPYTDQDRARSTTSPAPVFRSSRVSSFVVLKDGQSEQFSTATDRFSGEVVKMDVTLSVVK